MDKCTYCEANALVTYCKSCGTIAPDCADGRLKQAAPALLAALTERVPGLSLPNPEDDFANDLDEIASIVEADGFNNAGAGLRAKAQAIRAAVASTGQSLAEARGEER